MTCIKMDAPRAWGIYFQDSATPQMEGITELHDFTMYFLAIVLFCVGWILFSIVTNYRNATFSHKYLSHGTIVELIWTITPTIILLLVAFYSFRLLYLIDYDYDPAITVGVEAHQWYWSYEYPDFVNNKGERLQFDSYIVPDSDLEFGTLRMLEVDNRVIVPELTHIRFGLTSGDVIHSFACPSLGIKCDSYSGRLNQVVIYITREGVYYGQCSEICGILHSSMPIVIECVSIEEFMNWVSSK